MMLMPAWVELCVFAVEAIAPPAACKIRDRRSDATKKQVMNFGVNHDSPCP